VKEHPREVTTQNLVELIKHDKQDDAEKLRGKLKELREKNVVPYFDKLLHSLDTLNEFAYRYDVKLGIENRYFYFDIPDFTEMGVILTNFAGGNIYYWHDVGHAQMFEFLGLRNHTDFLDAYAVQLLGIHLHDMVEERDHQSPGKGNIEFKMVSKYLKPETVRVLEVHPPDTADDLRAGVEILQTAGI
ncbi:MAG: hypothetical protein QME64_08180, partial [bacterium]|nr:hypothetical protein [bacterium]